MAKTNNKLDTTENSKYKGIRIGPMQNKAHWMKIRQFGDNSKCSNTGNSRSRDGGKMN